MSFETDIIKVQCWEALANDRPGDIGNQIKEYAKTYKELLMIQEYQWEERKRENVGLTMIRAEIERKIRDLLDDKLQRQRIQRI